MPAAAAAAAVAVMVGVAALHLVAGGGTPTAIDASAPVTVAPVDTDTAPGSEASADAERSAAADRADRGMQRSTPSPSASRTPASQRSTSPPAAGGAVTSSGTCQASYYATGSTTANGEAFDPDGITAAHRTLPFNTRVRVTNLANGSAVTVRINDRGPFVDGRCLDLSRGAFKSIASLGAGVISIRYEVLA